MMKPIISVLCILLWAVPAGAEDYHPGDVEVVNNILRVNDAENGVLAKAGWEIGRPETWPVIDFRDRSDEPVFDRIQLEIITGSTGVTWENGRLVELALAFKQLSGSLDVGGLSELRVLGVVSNRLTEIKGLDTLTKLEAIKALNNALTSLGDISGLTRLRYLDLASNKLTALSGLSGLTGLTYLRLGFNDLADIGDLSPLTALESLKVGHNRLTRLDGLERLSSLRSLDVADNRLTRLDGLKKLKELSYLYIGGNQFDSYAFIKEANLNRLIWFSFSGFQFPRFSLAGRFANLDNLSISGCADLQWVDVAGKPLNRLDLSDRLEPAQLKNAHKVQHFLLIKDVRYSLADIAALRQKMSLKTQFSLFPQSAALGDAASGLKPGRAYTPAELSPALGAEYAVGGPGLEAGVFIREDGQPEAPFSRRESWTEISGAFQDGRITFPGPGDYYLTLYAPEQPEFVIRLTVNYDDVFRVTAD